MSNAIFTELTKNAETATKEIMKTVSAIVDENSFVETDKFICGNTDLGEAVGEGVVGGFANFLSVRVGLFATNPNVLMGSIGKANANNIVKIIDSSVKAGLPVVAVLDTQGARFGEGIDAMEGYAEIFAALSDAYGIVPTVTAVKGSDYGLSSYFCAVSDLCVAFAGAQIATSSPLILAGNGKDDPAKICTGKLLGETSDVVTNVVANEKELKTVISSFLSAVTEPVKQTADNPNRTAKAAALKKCDDMLKEIFDANSKFAVREGYAKEVYTGFARMDGIAVGYVAIDGKLTKEGAGKITELLNTCESFSLPVINLVNCDGAESSSASDGATIRAVSDMMFTFNSLSVPKLALVYGNAIGLGYTAFAAKSNVDYSVAWTDAKIGTVSGEAAAQLLYADEISKAKNKAQAAAKLATAYAEENLLAPAVAKKGYLDNVIEPALSRPYLIAALQTFISKEH